MAVDSRVEVSEDRKRISAKEIIGDIRAGMSAEELQEKYSLTHLQLESVLSKLVNGGLLASRECLSINSGTPGSPSAAEGNGPSESRAISKADQDSMNTSGTESKPHAKNVAGLIPRTSTGFILTGALIPLFILDSSSTVKNVKFN